MRIASETLTPSRSASARSMAFSRGDKRRAVRSVRSSGGMFDIVRLLVDSCRPLFVPSRRFSQPPRNRARAFLPPACELDAAHSPWWHRHKRGFRHAHQLSGLRFARVATSANVPTVRPSDCGAPHPQGYQAGPPVGSQYNLQFVQTQGVVRTRPATGAMSSAQFAAVIQLLSVPPPPSQVRVAT